METQTDHTTTNNLSDLAPDQKKKATNVALPSAHFFGLTARALEDRKKVLASLAKDARAEGYEADARNIESDIAAIEAVILPQFRMQRELPVIDGEKFEKAVGDALAGIVRKAFAGLDDPKAKVPTADVLKRRVENCVRELGSRVASYSRDVADSAYRHGYQVRVTDNDVIAAGQLRTLNGGRAD
jgi:hypothetical protein